jgi:predicted nucleic acid-binding protein
MADSYALDTNVYVHALRNTDSLARLRRFRLRAGTRLHLHAVVVLELRAGVRTPAHDDAVERLFSVYASRERVVVPSFDAYTHAGRVLSALSVRERVSLATAPPSLTNDALLAASCREAGVVLVTENSADFTAIQRHLRGFRFADAAGVLR